MLSKSSLKNVFLVVERGFVGKKLSCKIELWEFLASVGSLFSLDGSVGAKCPWVKGWGNVQ